MSGIDPRAMVSCSAKLGKRCSRRRLRGYRRRSGTRRRLHCRYHAVVQGPSKFGRNNHFYSFAPSAAIPGPHLYGERVTLEVGDSNEFREYSTVNRGTQRRRLHSHRQQQSHHGLRAHRARLRVGNPRSSKTAPSSPAISCRGLRRRRRFFPRPPVHPHRKHS